MLAAVYATSAVISTAGVAPCQLGVTPTTNAKANQASRVIHFKR